MGFVDLTPLVNLVDGDGNATARPRIDKCPYMRLQGGANAVIMDPAVGDIAFVSVWREIFDRASTRLAVPPDSQRRENGVCTARRRCWEIRDDEARCPDA